MAQVAAAGAHDAGEEQYYASPAQQYAPSAPHYVQPAQPSPPGVAVAGFVLAIVGFVFPMGVWWWVGLGLSWAGYNQAKRESLPTGLALAGLIINAVMTALSVLGLLFLIVLIAAS